MNTVDCEVEGGEAASEETSPPPVVILGTKVEVAEEDGGLGAGDDQDHKHEEEKSVHVVDLTGPDTVENKKQLDENAAEGQNAAHDDAGDGLGVNRLVRDLSGYLVGPHWLFDAGFSEAEVGPDESKRDGYSKPESEERHQGEEWDGGR